MGYFGRTLIGVAATVAALALFAGSLGSMRVVVQDESGAGLGGVKVTLTLKDTGQSRDLTTNAKGRTRFPGIPGGEVYLRFELDGYQILEKNARVLAGATETMEVVLVRRAPEPAEVEPTPEEIRRRDSAALYNEAVTLFRDKRFDEAEARVTEALAVEPDLAPAYLLVGRLRSRAGEACASADAYIRALELDPSLKRHLPELIGELQKAGRDEEAARYEARIAAAEAETPASPDELYNLAVVKINAGDDAAALSYLERVLALDASHGPALFNRGLIRLREGDKAAALADMRHYLEIAPGGEFAGQARGMVQALGG